jgi:hypothetical protein
MQDRLSREVRDEQQFEQFVRSGLAQYEIEVDEVELRVMHAVEQAYGPSRDALLVADLSDVEPELGLDPSNPPPLHPGDDTAVTG